MKEFFFISSNYSLSTWYFDIMFYIAVYFSFLKIFFDWFTFLENLLSLIYFSRRRSKRPCLVILIFLSTHRRKASFSVLVDVLCCWKKKAQFWETIVSRKVRHRALQLIVSDANSKKLYRCVIKSPSTPPLSTLSIFQSCLLDIVKQGFPWHSGNYRVWILSETRTWHDKNIQSNVTYR